MDRNDRQAIDDLFEKLAAVEENAPQRDSASEALIRERIARQPSAPYYMAQTIVVQNQALAAAEARIAGHEGRTGAETRRSGSVPTIGRGEAAELQQGAWRRGPADTRQGGGGFLAGAVQTALGVAGGVLLGNAIAGMFGGGGEAQAAETNAQTEEPQAQEPQAQEPQTEEPETESAGYDDGGFDAGGDFGDF